MNKNKNFFDELDTTDWADILSNTYERISSEIGRASCRERV